MSEPIANAPEVAAVVVSFHPDVPRLLALAGRLQEQGCLVIVVDNGSPMPAVQEMLGGGNGEIHWVCLPENVGVGAAQNAGIRVARQAGVRYVALFDQDSQPDDSMIAALLAVAKEVEGRGQKLAAVGACYRDARQNNPPPFIRTAAGRLHRMRRQGAEHSVEVDYVISSGSLIPLSTLDAVGLMDESLFIDYVDIEWGLRARARGYLSYGAWEALLHHELGDDPVIVGRRAYPARSPLRYYYMFRNVWALMRKPYVPRGWKFVESYRLVLRAIVWVGFGRGDARRNFHAMARGMRDGWRGMTGPMPAEYESTIKKP